MSKWLVTFEYEYSITKKEHKNKFVEFKSEYPTKEEIQELGKNNVKIIEYTFGNAENNYKCDHKIYPIILFMQKIL